MFVLASFLSATDLAVAVDVPVPFMFVINLKRKEIPLELSIKDEMR